IAPAFGASLSNAVDKCSKANDREGQARQIKALLVLYDLLLLSIRLSGQYQYGQDQGHDTDWHIDEKDRIPGKTGAQVAANRWAEGGCHHHGNTKHGVCHSTLVRWEDAENDCERDWKQCPTTNALENAEDNQRFFCWSKGTEGRANRKECQSCQKEWLGANRV